MPTGARAREHQCAVLDLQADVVGCRALLLEIVRRAASDWVLYRASQKPEEKLLAEEAQYWLFREEQASATWQERESEEGLMTAFVYICDVLDLEPEHVRERVRAMTIRDVMGVGRPPERRTRRVEDGPDHEHSVFSVNVEDLASFESTFASG